ncbi:MAG: PQQ-binding-like beta-propeller repeat protein, partial [Verrucomicrobiaceae bacterium]|nr:PQQ-binding-like beta-propeller repeat protein [Verrucomicrobiaceae bacterium]
MTLRILFLLSALGAPLFAENWPQWRGPRLDGTSRDTGFPVSADQSVTWKIELPGSGHASPIVWNDRLFTVAAMPENEERVLLCLDRATGKQLWQSVVLKAPPEGIHKLNSLASSTPATDGERIFTAFLDNTPTEATRKANEGRVIPKGEVPKGTVVVSAHDFTGKPLWQVKPGLFSSKHGFCSSPILFEDKVIVNCDHDGDGYIVALAKTDGKELWRIDRPNKTRSYCVPLIREIAGRTQMVLSGTMCVASYDPHTGKQLWIIDGPTEQFVASLVFSDKTGLLYMTGGFPEHHLLAIKPDGSGDVTNSHIVWRTNKGVAYVPSPIVEGDYFFIVSDSGVAHCFDAKSGEIAWEERLREHHASLASAEGRVYFINDFGVLRTVLPEKSYKLVAESELKEKVFASPALSEGQIFIRTDKSMI